MAPPFALIFFGIEMVTMSSSSVLLLLHSGGDSPCFMRSRAVGQSVEEHPHVLEHAI